MGYFAPIPFVIAKPIGPGDGGLTDVRPNAASAAG
jgi:hypothetical protein